MFLTLIVLDQLNDSIDNFTTFRGSHFDFLYFMTSETIYRFILYLIVLYKLENGLKR
jgi:hypothetical protein